MGVIRYKDIAYGGGSSVTEGYYKVADGKFYEHYDGTTYSDEITGEDGILYVDLSTNNLYRWSTGASLFVLVGKSTLASLNDTNIATPTDGQALEYNGTSSKWVNVAKKAADTPTFSEATGTRSNIVGSGETMATILGKIKRWFADLKDLAFIGKDGASSTKYLRGDGTWQAFPAIPTVNDKTLIIQKNGTQVAQFTANSASDVTANITVPTNTSDLTNDSGYVTADENVKQSNTTSSTVRSILLASNNSTSAATAQAYKDSNLKYKPSTQTLTAGTFDGIATKVKYEGNYGGAWISGSATANTEVTGSNDYIPTSAAVVNYINNKLDYFTVVNSYSATATKTSVATYSSRKFSDYKMLMFLVYDTSGYRASMFLPRGTFTSSTSMYVSLTWVDSSNTQYWVEITYKDDTHCYIQAKSNAAGKVVNVYGLH